MILPGGKLVASTAEELEVQVFVNKVLMDLDQLKASVDLLQEVAMARNGNPDLAGRLALHERYLSPTAAKYIPGNYYDNAMVPAASGNLSPTDNGVILSPFFAWEQMRVDQIGLNVTTASAGAIARCFIYEGGVDGWPDHLLFESEDLLLGTAGFIGQTLQTPFSFAASKAYWIGARFNAAPTRPAVRSTPISSALNLGLLSATSNQYYTCLMRQFSLSSPMPSRWNFVKNDLRANATPPSVRMRCTL